MYSIRALPPSRPFFLPLFLFLIKIAILYYTNTNPNPRGVTPGPVSKAFIHLSPTHKTVTLQYASSFSATTLDLLSCTAKSCLKTTAPHILSPARSLSNTMTPLSVTYDARQSNLSSRSSSQTHHTHYRSPRSPLPTTHSSPNTEQNTPKKHS